jgi:alpha-D-ribose 1-methylphosphonate 5-triphosphate synthase subunit PhnG
MTRRERTEVLIEGDPALRSALAAEVSTHPLAGVLEAPSLALVMLPLRESAQQSLFFLGEVLVTQARVRVGDAIGLGIIAGDQPEAALALAWIDAAYRAELPEAQRWGASLAAAAERLRRDRRRDHAQLQQTCVRFETMEGV